jgi:GT2 family glycosyltransferase
VRTAILLLSVDEEPMLAYSLPAAIVQEDCDVYVVDNASSDLTGDLAMQHRAEYIRIEERLTYAAALNLALRRTRGEAVLFLNADCFLEPDFLTHARPRLDEDRVGSVAGKLLRCSGPTDFSRAEIDAAGMLVDRRRKNGLVAHGRAAREYSTPGECFGADGACALYRREVLEQCAVDGEVFDEEMALWASDADLAWRAQLLGWRCAYEPRASGRHVRTYSPSTRSSVSAAHRRLQFRNRYLMWAKNETRKGLLHDCTRIAAYEVAALGYALLRERELLGGYREAWQALPGARRRRHAVQSRRAVARPPFGLTPERGRP